MARVSDSGARELQSGALRVRITINAAGALENVTLPPEVPDRLTSAALAGILAQLAAFPLPARSESFRDRVWQRMAQIPWGHALTYQELAAAVGNPGASRAVGTACAKNPLPLIVPCHRVLASSGLGGFAYGTSWKAALLALETEARPA